MAVLAETERRDTPARRLGWRGGVRDAVPLAVAGIVANGGSLLVTVVLARVLGDRDYGALNQLIGVFFVVSTPGSAVLVGMVRRVTCWTGPLAEVARWGSALHRRATAALVVLALVVVAAGPSLSSLLGRHDVLGFDAITIGGAVWVLLCVDRGLLQAHREYRTLSGNMLLEGGARTVCMIGFGAAFGVAGVAVGVLAAELCTAVHARLVADRAWRVPDGVAARRWLGAGRGAGSAITGMRRGIAALWQPDARYGRDRSARRDLGAAVAALAAIAVLQNIDVIVMGGAAARAAGSYAAVSVSSKALVFVAIAVASYLLPEAAICWREGRHALRQLAASLAVIGVPAAALVGVAAGVPHLFLKTVFSARYVSAVGAFLPLALAMVCLSVTVMVTMYLLGIGDRRIVAALLGAAILATVAVVLAGRVPKTTALADLGVQGALLCVAVVELVRVHRTLRGAGSESRVPVTE